MHRLNECMGGVGVCGSGAGAPAGIAMRICTL